MTAAYLNNPTLLGQRAKVRATDEQVPQALSNWRPSISLSGSISRSMTTNTARTFGGQNQIRPPRGADLKISQLIYRGGRTFAATREAENTVQAERARLTETEQDVLLATATAYLNVFRDEAVLKLNINNEQVLKRQLEATRDRFKVGEFTRTDVHQAEARLAGANADRIDSEGKLEASRAAYRNVVGQPAPRNLKAPAAPAGEPETQAEANKAAALGYSAVLSAKFERKAQVGSRTVLDVLDAEQEFPDSRVAHVSAQRGELVAVFELKAAMGRLTAKELKLPVKAYDPDDHYRKVRDKWFGGSPSGGE